MGPCFGNRSFFDVKIRNAVEGNNYLGVENRTAFNWPSNANVTRAFTPEKDFKISELEIFQVNFES